MPKWSTQCRSSGGCHFTENMMLRTLTACFTSSLFFPLCGHLGHSTRQLAVPAGVSKPRSTRRYTSVPTPEATLKGLALLKVMGQWRLLARPLLTRTMSLCAGNFPSTKLSVAGLWTVDEPQLQIRRGLCAGSLPGLPSPTSLPSGTSRSGIRFHVRRRQDPYLARTRVWFVDRR